MDQISEGNETMAQRPAARSADSASPTTRRGVLGAMAGLSGLSGGALAGCGGVAASQPAASKQPVTIEVLTRAGVASPSGHSQFYNAITPQQFTPESGITVRFIDAEPDVAQKLLVLAAGNTLPDVSWFGAVGDGAGGPEAAEKGIFKPLDELLKKDSKFDTRPYFKALLDAFSTGGKLYALPVHGHYGTNVLYYNPTLTRAAGVNVPADGNWTVDEFLAAAQKIVRRGDDVWGWQPGGIGDMNDYGNTYVRTWGGEFLDEAGKRCLLDGPESRAALEWVGNAAFKAQTINDLFRPGGGFENGQIAFANATPAQVATWKRPGQTVLKFDVGVAVWPKGPTGRRGSNASGSGMGLVSSRHQAASYEWIKFITSKEVGVIGAVSGGAGTPGGRTDAWNDPRLLAFDPVYANLIKAYPQGIGALRRPANHKRPDVLKVASEELLTFYRGSASINDATARAVQRANAVLAG